MRTSRTSTALQFRKGGRALPGSLVTSGFSPSILGLRASTSVNKEINRYVCMYIYIYIYMYIYIYIYIYK